MFPQQYCGGLILRLLHWLSMLLQLVARKQLAHMHDAAREIAFMADANQCVRHAQPRHNLRGGCRSVTQYYGAMRMGNRSWLRHMWLDRAWVNEHLTTAIPRGVACHEVASWYHRAPGIRERRSLLRSPHCARIACEQELACVCIMVRTCIGTLD